MMLSYPGLSKLKTKQVVYQNALLARDSGTLEQLKELSSKRKAVEESINENSFVTEAIAREMSGGLTSRCEQGIQKLENYLPLLENLVHHVDLLSNNSRMTCWISDLKISWSSSLTSSSIFHLNGPKFYQIKDLRFELGMTLFLYGAMLRERALQLLSTDLVRSATILRKASGVYHYLAHEVLPPLQTALPQERPPEGTSGVSSVMSLICLADAQAVTVKKAEENGNTGGLLAKLHYEGLRNDGQIGTAVGVLRLALANAKSMPKEESWRLVSKQVIDDLTGLLRKYEHENDFVWHEKANKIDRAGAEERKWKGLPTVTVSVRQFIVPMRNRELDSRGLLGTFNKAEGTIGSFKEILSKELPDAKVLEPTPGYH
ncbi:unnamed protein product [Fraxinus pennsylvanica]|uniref:BRO1 domain-containing protein n=1 Tax=Fraxinus pennsylvanica TaxID=56036 RepID=A0AAD2ABW9_9LAMI|nr:unnamed protein product [Fraxinus pennsylvanica]